VSASDRQSLSAVSHLQVSVAPCRTLPHSAALCRSAVLNQLLLHLNVRRAIVCGCDLPLPSASLPHRSAVCRCNTALSCRTLAPHSAATPHPADLSSLMLIPMCAVSAVTLAVPCVTPAAPGLPLLVAILRGNVRQFAAICGFVRRCVAVRFDARPNSVVGAVSGLRVLKLGLTVATSP